VTLAAEFRYQGGSKPGGPATVTLFADGNPIGEGRIERTVPRRFSLSETFDVGLDSGTPVTEDYASPAAFTGALSQVRVRLLDGATGG
jgi:arylsulfatase